MTTTLATHESSEVTIVDTGRLDEHPAAVYLAGLSKGSRRTMRQALDKIAVMVAGEGATALDIPWPY
jgi:hypothetical protein